jgi:hypothetical protein
MLALATVAPAVEQGEEIAQALDAGLVDGPWAMAGAGVDIGQEDSFGCVHVMSSWQWKTSMNQIDSVMERPAAGVATETAPRDGLFS